jgi:adenylate kinase family enzyme
MRVVVIGTSGSGKTTFADRLAEAAGLARIDLDAINWQAGWIPLDKTEPGEFVRRVEAVAAAPAWASCGNYSTVRDRLLRRATHVVWLDYPRTVIMRRVIGRSFRRALLKDELWPGTGNREEFRRWLDKDHPIRWAWDTYHHRRDAYAATFDDPALADVEKHRLQHPREAQPLLERLARGA